MKNEIKVGNVVKLQSGGRVMTVNKVEEDTAECVWNTRTEQGNRAYAQDALKIYEPDIPELLRDVIALKRKFVEAHSFEFGALMRDVEKRLQGKNVGDLD